MIGGAGKLLKYFRDRHEGSIVSYADMRWSSGNLYEKLGFVLDGVTPPGYDYYNLKKKTLHSRMNFQKKKLKKMEHYDENLSEYDIMRLNGYDRIWN